MDDPHIEHFSGLFSTAFVGRSDVEMWLFIMDITS